jgi:urea transport system permease protein
MKSGPSLRLRAICSLCTVLAALCFATLALTPVRADPFEDAVAHFATDSFADTQRAVGEIATSGLPTGPAILEALAANRLLFDLAGKLYYRDAAGAVFDARSGAKVDVDADSLKRVRLNNGVRSALNAAQGVLTLAAPDPAQRLRAAESVFKTRDAAARPALDALIAKETDSRVKTAFTQARAAIMAADASTPEAERLAAVDIIRARGDQEALALLGQVSAASDGRVKASAETGVAAIQSRLRLFAHAQNVIYGLSLGSVLLLAAIGLAITFGVMGVINMAHGEMVMLGAYATYIVQQVLRAYAPGWMDVSLFIAIPVAFLLTGLAGILIERSIIRFLYGRPLETLLATFGLSLVLQQAVRTAFGANNRDVATPPFMAGSVDFAGLTLTSGRLWIIVFAILVFVLLQLVLRATPFGLRMRAVTQNRRMASAMGIDTNRVDALAFGLGSGIAGIAGVALSQIDNVSPNLGQGYIIDSFMVVVFGGVGNLWGTLVAALTLGVANKFLEPFIGAVLGKIALLVFIILFIQKRPRGMFALKGRAVEA